MVGPKTFGNVGFVARCMKNFGAGQLIILAPRYELDDGVYGFAMHGRDIIDQATVVNCNETEIVLKIEEISRKYELVAGSTAKPPNRSKLYRVPVDPRDAAPRLVSTKALLVLGREDSGLTDAELKCCDLVISIPANAEYPTMNVSHAAAIILYEFWLARPSLPVGCGRHYATSATEEFFPAAREARQQFHDWFSRAVKTHLTGITDEWRLENFIVSVKNILERAPITNRELAIMDGFLRKVEIHFSRKKG
ncbi:MAG: RNA methyltransferase [Candidatus Sigynarchaeum springense]